MSNEDQHVELVKVTPDLAHDWLGYNTHNRKLRERVVNAYAADMAAGDWQWNGESVKFAHDGTLLDGQHRLAAVIAAGAEVSMLVVRGLPKEAQDTVDGGAKRKFADVLQLRGESQYTRLASIVRMVRLWDLGIRRSISGSNYTPTNAQMFQTLEKYPDLRDLAVAADQVSRGCGLPPSVIGLCWWMFGRLDAEDANFFFDRLRDGQNLAKGDPIYELRRTLDATKSVRGTRSQNFLTAITVKAWNAYRKGDKIGILRYRPGGANPESFPEPI